MELANGCQVERLSLFQQGIGSVLRSETNVTCTYRLPLPLHDRNFARPDVTISHFGFQPLYPLGHDRCLFLIYNLLGGVFKDASIWSICIRWTEESFNWQRSQKDGSRVHEALDGRSSLWPATEAPCGSGLSQWPEPMLHFGHCQRRVCTTRFILYIHSQILTRNSVNLIKVHFLRSCSKKNINCLLLGTGDPNIQFTIQLQHRQGMFCCSGD